MTDSTRPRRDIFLSVHLSTTVLTKPAVACKCWFAGQNNRMAINASRVQFLKSGTLQRGKMRASFSDWITDRGQEFSPIMYVSCWDRKTSSQTSQHKVIRYGMKSAGPLRTEYIEVLADQLLLSRLRAAVPKGIIFFRARGREKLHGPGISYIVDTWMRFSPIRPPFTFAITSYFA